MLILFYYEVSWDYEIWRKTNSSLWETGKINKRWKYGKMKLFSMPHCFDCSSNSSLQHLISHIGGRMNPLHIMLPDLNHCLMNTFLVAQLLPCWNCHWSFGTRMCHTGMLPMRPPAENIAQPSLHYCSKVHYDSDIGPDQLGRYGGYRLTRGSLFIWRTTHICLEHPTTMLV